MAGVGSGLDRQAHPCSGLQFGRFSLTENWSDNETRYRGLEKSFPPAVTCDFKARDSGVRGEHTADDLKRCFSIGWRAGFRGPWCREHAPRDRKRSFRELAMLRDMLRHWMAESSSAVR